MPAFTFEKIAPPVEREPSATGASTLRRGALKRLVDRLVPGRLRKSAGGSRKDQQKKQK